MLKDFEKLSEEGSLCDYCSATGYGEHSSAEYANSTGCHWCEGAYCKDAYIKYLEKTGATESVIKYAKLVL